MANDRASTAMVTLPSDQQEPRALVQHAHSEQAILTHEGLKLAAEQRALLKEYVEQQMIEGTDYGTIPGTDKDTLYKPGAEKLVELFRCTPKFHLLKEKQDFEIPLFSYRFRCRLLQRDANVILAEGYGSCNSRESRYRYRNAAPKCPSCGKEALFRSKKAGEGFYCWSKKGGCGAQYPANDESVKAAFAGAGKVENPDVADLDNTILKMAKKRALVDAAIALARVSDLFTQDAEDSVPSPSSAEFSDVARQAGPITDAPKKAPPPAKPAAEKQPIWKEVVAMAHDYGFECGEGNKLLWAYCADVTSKKPASAWTDADYLAIEKAMAAKMGGKTEQPPPPEDDIPF